MQPSKKLSQEMADILIEGAGKEHALYILRKALEKAKRQHASKSVLESLRRVIEYAEKAPVQPI